MEDVPTRAVELAYPLDLDGTVHEAGATVTLRADPGNEGFATPNARQLVRDGRARYVDEAEQVDAAPAPPKSGSGSGRAEWAAYAQQRGVAVTEDMSREQIMSAVDPGAATSENVTTDASGAKTGS